MTGTYNMEVGGFGVVIADPIAKIEAALAAGIPIPELVLAAARAAALVKPLKDAKDAAVTACEDVLATAVAALAALTNTEAVLNAAAVVAPADAAVADAPPQARGGDVRRVAQRVNYATLAGGAQRTPAERAAEAAAKAEKTKATGEVAAARLGVEKAKADRATWVDSVGPLTAAEFEAYGRAVVQPGYDYFTKLFVASNGEMWGIKMAYRGATVLDALKLATMDLATASLLVDNLEHFNFPEFTLDFRGHLKAELPLLLLHARKPFDWSAVSGAAEYDAALARQLKLKETKAAAAAAAHAAAASSSSSSAPPPPEIPEASERTEEEFFDWKQGPAERARRLWLWWVPRVGEFSFWPRRCALSPWCSPRARKWSGSSRSSSSSSIRSACRGLRRATRRA